MSFQLVQRLFCSRGSLFLLLAVVFGLASCGFTNTGDIIAESVKRYGEQAYDRGLVNAEFFMCRAASIGAVSRRYFHDQSKFESWVRICSDVPSSINNVGISSDAVPDSEQLVEWNVLLE